MNARERLKAFIVQNTYSHDMPYRLSPDCDYYGHELDITDDDYPSVVEAEMDAFQNEVLHKAAEKIRRQRHEDHDQIKCVPCFVYGTAADLIDPEVKQ